MQTDNKPFFFVGKTVVLRPLNQTDASLLYAWMGEPFFHYYKPYLKNICRTEHSLRQRIETLSSLDMPFEREALILHRRSNTPIGLVALSNIDDINLKAEFSMAFRRGLGTRCDAETIEYILNYVFVSLGLNKLYFYVTSDNIKTLKMIRRRKILQEGKLYKEVLSESHKWLDLYRFCILREDWLGSHIFKRLERIAETLK
jgi:RimJ/RimL family protein N-acetyltransferase